MSRLKQLRIAKGLSLDQLAAAMQGAVTKQALSKYERGAITPSPSVATCLAKALGVNTLSLWTTPATKVEFIAYRKKMNLGKKESATIEAKITEIIQRRVDLQERCLRNLSVDVPVHGFYVTDTAGAEDAAMSLRARWNLGVDPIADITALLEDHLVHVIQIKADPGFDGLSALAERDQIGRIAVAVISRDDVPGDRQRFNLVHELGHLVMRVPPGSDEEALASRFAGAFLVPSSVLMRELGQNRTSLNLKELLILKRYFKVSIQSLVRRAFELNIISQPAYQAAFTYISRMGWRKSEPEPLAKEKSRWMERTVLRGVAEGMISSIEAHEFVGAAFPLDAQSGLMRRKKFLSLPIAQQDDQLRAQAEKLAKFYEKTEWSALDSEDFHELK